MQIIRAIFSAYQQHNIDEAQGLQKLESLLATHAAPQWIDRKNFTGHVTASGIIIRRETEEVLLIRHNALRRWLQPGGHIDPHDATPMDAAMREVWEEVGIGSERLTLLSPTEDRHLPLDIDTHFIPANPAKSESSHYHHDYRYVFVMNGDANLRAQVDEVAECRWVPMKELGNGNDLKRVGEKLCAVVDTAG